MARGDILSRCVVRDKLTCCFPESNPDRLAAALTSRQLYGECIGWFYQIFKAFEASIDETREKAHVREMYPVFDKMRRTPAFEEDLKFYLGEKDWKEKLTLPEGIN